MISTKEQLLNNYEDMNTHYFIVSCSSHEEAYSIVLKELLEKYRIKSMNCTSINVVLNSVSDLSRYVMENTTLLKKCLNMLNTLISSSYRDELIKKLYVFYPSNEEATKQVITELYSYSTCNNSNAYSLSSLKSNGYSDLCSGEYYCNGLTTLNSDEKLSKFLVEAVILKS